jgi:hypothetical protein
MCIFEKLSQECKNENTIYLNQMKRLALCAANIESHKDRENLVNFFEILSNVKECNNLKYIMDFSQYISKINSIALKDKIVEVIKVIEV